MTPLFWGDVNPYGNPIHQLPSMEISHVHCPSCGRDRPGAGDLFEKSHLAWTDPDTRC
jgi:hypothetical protein